VQEDSGVAVSGVDSLNGLDSQEGIPHKEVSQEGIPHKEVSQEVIPHKEVSLEDGHHSREVEAILPRAVVVDGLRVQEVEARAPHPRDLPQVLATNLSP